MKPKFGWIYLFLVISVAILVITSSSFYREFHQLKVHAENLNHNYQVFTHLRDLKQLILEAESNARGFMVTKDSSYITGIESLRPEIQLRVDSLKLLFGKESAQVRRLILLHSNLNGRMNSLYRNIHAAATDDTLGLAESLKRGQQFMNAVKEDAEAIEYLEVAEGHKTRHNLNDFAEVTPISFNIILAFAGLVTLVSFLFILREMRIRVRYQNELERKLKELNSSTAELERFTYVASHDLQEPLRKIRTFSDRLMSKHRETMNEEAAKIVERLDASSHRMQDLIQDMVNFTNLINKNETAIACDLNAILERALYQLRTQIDQKNALIKYDKLPVIKGFNDQLALLFRSLIENSLKFSDGSRTCEISIHYHQVEGGDVLHPDLPSKRLFHQVAFKDNGIGFDNEFASRIFLIFQRLHSQESPYYGKGIGLAIAQRVVTNHNGIIIAKGIPGEGATFIIYFPVE